MAANPNLIGPLDWEPFSWEHDLFLSLKAVWRVLELDRTDLDMENMRDFEENLHKVMDEWHDQSSEDDSYRLFINMGDGSGVCKFSQTRTSVLSWKNVVIRYDNGLCYGCGYFAEPPEDQNLQVAAQLNNVEGLTSATSASTSSEPDKTVRGTKVSINQLPEKYSNVKSSITMDDLVPGGRWIQTPGNSR